MNSDLIKVSKRLDRRMKEYNPNSFLAWVSGTAVDYWKDVEVNDYDLVFCGLSKQELGRILENEFGNVKFDPNSLVLNSKTQFGKKIDAMVLSIFEYSDYKNNWKFNDSFSKYTLQKDEISPYRLLRDIQETGATRFSNRGLYYIFPSLKKVTKRDWFQDLKNKRCRVLRHESRYVFYDYMRLFRFSSMGYDIEENTKRLMVENSLLKYLVWNDRNVEPDRISEYQDSLLKYILKVYDQKKRGLVSYPSRFFNLCVITSLFNLLFDQKPDKVNPDSLDSPEAFVLNIFKNRESLLENLEGHYIFKNNYDLL